MDSNAVAAKIENMMDCQFLERIKVTWMPRVRRCQSTVMSAGLR